MKSFITNIMSDFFRFRVHPWSLITAAGAVAGVCSIFGFFGSFYWFLDLCSHFRVQYFLGLGIASLLLLIPRQYKISAVFGALSLVNLGVILPLYFGKAPVPAANVHPIRVLLINVETRIGKANKIADVIGRFEPDIIVLEEVNPELLSGLGPVLSEYHDKIQEPREDNFGIATYSKLPFTQSRIIYIGDAEVPSVIADIETAFGNFTLLATHPPPPAGAAYSRLRNGQLEGLPNVIREAVSPVLLLGDLNVTPWSPHFTRLLRESGLKDSSQGRGVQPTWPSYFPLLLIPIDHCLYSPRISILNKQIGPSVGSDHYPVIVDFLINTNKN